MDSTPGFYGGQGKAPFHDAVAHLLKGRLLIACSLGRTAGLLPAATSGAAGLAGVQGPPQIPAEPGGPAEWCGVRSHLFFDGSSEPRKTLPGPSARSCELLRVGVPPPGSIDSPRDNTCGVSERSGAHGTNGPNIRSSRPLGGAREGGSVTPCRGKSFLFFYTPHIFLLTAIPGSNFRNIRGLPRRGILLNRGVKTFKSG